MGCNGYLLYINLHIKQDVLHDSNMHTLILITVQIWHTINGHKKIYKAIFIFTQELNSE